MVYKQRIKSIKQYIFLFTRTVHIKLQILKEQYEQQSKSLISN